MTSNLLMGGFDDLPSKGRVATILSCSSTLTNTILGAGVLGLPYAVSKSGFIVGPLLLAVACVFSSFGLHLLSVCAAKDDGNSSFYSVAHTALPAFTTLIDFIVAIKCFGVAVSLYQLHETLHKFKSHSFPSYYLDFIFNNNRGHCRRHDDLLEHCHRPQGVDSLQFGSNRTTCVSSPT